MAFESYGSQNFVGRDGFHWWVGQVEETDKNDKNSNRYKVRIVGHHLADCEGQGTDDLPWANTVAPTTTPFSAASQATTKMNPGDWVIGFYMDSEMAQQPYILGSIGTIRNSNGEGDAALGPFLTASQAGCRAFKNFAPGPIQGSPHSVIPYTKSDVNAAVAGATPTAQQPPGSATNPDKGVGQPSAVTYNQCPGSAMNEAAVKCTTISQADCPTGKTASMLEIVLSELFKAISQSGGQVGSMLTSKVTGYARDAESFVMGYVNKIMAIIFQSYSWLKGKLYNLIQQGVQYLINTLLSLISDKAKPKDAKPPYDPKKPEKLLDQIQKFLEDQLGKIGCTIDSLYDKILKFVTDFVMGLVEDFWSAALCGIESMVNSLLSSLQNILNEAIASIINPLLSILEGIAAPLNEVFGTIFEIMSFLGISCAGLPANCKKVIQDCGEGPKTKAKGLMDDLDALLSAIAGDTKPAPAVAQCADALKPVVEPVNVAISGGTPIPVPITPIITPGGPAGTGTTGPTDPTLSIILQPTSITKNLGNSHTFTVVASSSNGSVISYQWQKLDAAAPVAAASWTDITGATSSTYTISSIAVSDDGDAFRCVCSAAGHLPPSETSDDAYLYVNPASVTPTVPNSNYNTSVYGILDFTSDINVIYGLAAGATSNYVSNNVNNNNPSVVVGGTSKVLFKPNSVVPLGAAGVSYTLTATPSLVQPGGTVTLSLQTQGIANGTMLNFYIFGFNLAVTDVITGNLTGSFLVQNNTAQSVITFSNPVSFSQTQIIYAALQNGGAATQFALAGSPQPTTPVTPTPGNPNPPIACPPVVSKSGQIVSIGICSPGTRYLAAPQIYVQGNGRGYGASAVAVLDDAGYLSEIKVVRPGRGYPPNPPDGLDCVITGFTIIKPGFGYDKPPAVFVDGELGVAEAVIKNGVLVDITVIDKTKTFTDNPLIKIIPTSQGIGGIAIANIACLDPIDIQQLQEIVDPTPVGQYIDCP